MEFLESMKKKDMKPKFGYCAVTCDFLHLGHIEFLQACSLECKKLIVGIMTDEYVIKNKGRKPIMDMYQRGKLVNSIRYVHNVVLQNDYEFGEGILRARSFWGKYFVIIDSDEHNRKNADIIVKGGKKRKLGFSSTQYREVKNAYSDIGECTI